MGKVKGVIFDLDGTLVDSMWVWNAIDREFLGDYGYQVPIDLNSRIGGMSFTETAEYFQEHFSLPLTVEEIKERWNEMAFDKYCHEVCLKPGAEAFLKHLKARGIPLGIATSNSRRLVEQVLKSHGIDGYFAFIVTACEVKAGKPAPDIYLKAAENLGVLPEECLVFEDIPAGILAGKAAGMLTCAVEDFWSRDKREELLRLADYYIEGYGALGQKEAGHPIDQLL